MEITLELRILKIYRYGEKIEYLNPSLALGNFDGMHLGHIEVINKAKEIGDFWGVLLFDTENSPLSRHNADILTDIDEKIEILYNLGLDFVYIVPFVESFMNMSGEEFAEFLSQIGAKHIIVGYDYRCSKGASLDADGLSELLKNFDITCDVVKPYMIDESVVKSTAVRELLKAGDIKKANRMLLFPYSISGNITHGLKNGRDMGFPTANIKSNKNVLLPDGVYLARVYVNDGVYKSVVNIGKNPTFDAKTRTIEAHIIDYNSDIYGENIKVEFLEKIRGEIKFSSVEDLISQISKDVAYALSKDINNIGRKSRCI